MFVLSLLHMIGLNFMLILMSLGYTTTSAVIYIFLFLIGFVWSVGMIAVNKEISSKRTELPMEFQFIPDNFPMGAFSTYACSALIHAACYMYFIGFGPVVISMGVLLAVRFISAIHSKKVLTCPN